MRIGYGGLQLARRLVERHIDGDTARMTVEPHAPGAVGGNPLSVPRELGNIELVRADLAKGQIAKREGLFLAIACTRNRCVFHRESHRAVIDRPLRGGICGTQAETKGLAIRHVPTGEGLGSIDARMSAPVFILSLVNIREDDGA